jgi:25S rRNA (cytosine2870-C5)-methyltransferase
MGRRAKNKQAAPIPFSDSKDNGRHPSPKKLGKRKAEPEDIETSRPVKKVKETQSKGSTGKPKTKTTGGVKGKDDKTREKVKVSNSKVAGSDEASEGWEDVDDENDLKAQAK